MYVHIYENIFFNSYCPYLYRLATIWSHPYQVSRKKNTFLNSSVIKALPPPLSLPYINNYYKYCLFCKANIVKYVVNEYLAELITAGFTKGSWRCPTHSVILFSVVSDMLIDCFITFWFNIVLIKLDLILLLSIFFLFSSSWNIEWGSQYTNPQIETVHKTVFWRNSFWGNKKV